MEENLCRAQTRQKSYYDYKTREFTFKTVDQVLVLLLTDSCQGGRVLLRQSARLGQWIMRSFNQGIDHPDRYFK